MHESVVDTPSGDHVLRLRESFLELCDGDYPPAFLLSILEYWTNHERRENELRRRINADLSKKGAHPDDLYDINDSLWVRRTREELVEDSLGFLSKKQVTQAASTLEDMGLIETGHPFRASGDNTKHYRLRLDRLNAHLRSVSLTRQESDRKREEKIQDLSDVRGERTWDESDWQYRYAERWWERMSAWGDGRITRSMKKKREKILQRWADAFDWVVRVRQIDRDVLDQIIHWLFEEDDWWVQNGAIVAPTKFREKTDQDMWRINQFKMKANINETKDEDQLPDQGEEVPQYERDRLVQSGKADAEAFTSVRYADDGESKIYRYDG